MKNPEYGLAQRVTFSLMESDVELIAKLKKRCLTLGIDTNKSELVRAGLTQIEKMSDAQVKALLNDFPKLKTGRKKNQTK